MPRLIVFAIGAALSVGIVVGVVFIASNLRAPEEAVALPARPPSPRVPHPSSVEWIQRDADRATVLFVGEFRSVERVSQFRKWARNKIAIALDRKTVHPDTTLSVDVFSFVVVESFKGQVSGPVRVLSVQDDCAAEMRPNELVAVFGIKNRRGETLVRDCNDFINLADYEVRDILRVYADDSNDRQ